MSAGWESGRGGSIVARHEWKGLSKMTRLEDWVERSRLEEETAPARRFTRRTTRMRVPGAFDLEEEN